MTNVFDVFRSELQTYADRGIFQNLSCNNLGNNVSEFKFHWMTDKQFSLRLNLVKHQLELRNILPSVPYRSDMDNAFREFLLSRCRAELYLHSRRGQRCWVCTQKRRGIWGTLNRCLCVLQSRGQCDPGVGLRRGGHAERPGAVRPPLRERAHRVEPHRPLPGRDDAVARRAAAARREWHDLHRAGAGVRGAAPAPSAQG